MLILTSVSLRTVGSFVEIASDSVLHIQKPREVLSLIHNAFGKLYPLPCRACSAFELVLFTLEILVYVYKDTLMV